MLSFIHSLQKFNQSDYLLKDWIFMTKFSVGFIISHRQMLNKMVGGGSWCCAVCCGVWWGGVCVLWCCVVWCLVFGEVGAVVCHKPESFGWNIGKDKEFCIEAADICKPLPKIWKWSGLIKKNHGYIFIFFERFFKCGWQGTTWHVALLCSEDLEKRPNLSKSTQLGKKPFFSAQGKM